MRHRWKEQIRSEIDIIAPLTRHDDRSLDPRRLSDLDKSHQMHALGVGLFEQRFDPALIIADMTDQLKGLEKPAHHSGNSRIRLQTTAQWL